jgi:4-hydroxyphenylpyruvate dioxygenase-like putative hemolysin
MAERAAAGRLLHTIHAVRDYGTLREAYLQAFGGLAFAEGYHEGEDRDMNLLYVADHMIEPMAPRRPDEPDSTFSRFLAKYGEGWHSTSFQTPNAAQAAERLKAAGCVFTTDYPGFFFVHPKSTGGIILEVTDLPMGNDPYDLPSWNAEWAAGRPRLPHRLAYLAFVMRDTTAALHFLTTMMDGEHTGNERIDWPQPATLDRVAIGKSTFLLIQPDDADRGPLGAYLAKPASHLYAMGWDVTDPAATAAWLAEKSIPNDAASGVAEVEAVLNGARHWFRRSVA